MKTIISIVSNLKKNKLTLCALHSLYCPVLVYRMNHSFFLCGELPNNYTHILPCANRLMRWNSHEKYQFWMPILLLITFFHDSFFFISLFVGTIVDVFWALLLILLLFVIWSVRCTINGCVRVYECLCVCEYLAMMLIEGGNDNSFLSLSFCFSLSDYNCYFIIVFEKKYFVWLFWNFKRENWTI